MIEDREWKVELYAKLKMMDQKPDWQISELYSRAWEVIKKNKILWIFGATAGVGSGSSFRTSNFNSTDFQKFFSSPNNPSQSFIDSIFHILSAVPLYLYFLGAVELGLIILLGLAITAVYQAWSQGMLIQGTAIGLANQRVTIADTAKLVLPKLKSLLWLYIAPGLIFALALAIVTFILVLTIALVPFPLKILFIILGVVALGAAIYWGIFLAASLIWAPRETLLNSKSGKASLIAGYKIARKKFWPSLLLGVVNNILSVVIFIVPLILIAAIAGGLIFAGIKNPGSIIPLLITGSILAIPILIGFVLLSGIINSFKATVWTDAYQKIKGKYDH